jgi:DNA-binding HxlR family transcriptional regulator
VAKSKPFEALVPPSGRRPAQPALRTSDRGAPGSAALGVGNGDSIATELWLQDGRKGLIGGTRSEAEMGPARNQESCAADGAGGYCPYFQHVVELLGRRWTSSIVLHLTKGPARFSDIAGAIPGLSDRLLTERLHELEAENLVERSWIDTCTYYQFSDLGRELRPSIEALQAFSHKAAPTIVFADRPGRRC